LSLSVLTTYRFSGEQIVKACVDNSTHHVDISGESRDFF
jgi:short subunit dehydrogenase-like uncharacterized protein